MRKKLFCISTGIIISIILQSNACVLNQIYADEQNTILPEPIKVVDFSYDYEELVETDSNFEVVENAATPVLVEDEEMGQVLKLQPAVIKDYSYAEDNSQWRVDNSEYSTIKLSNPYVDREYLKEYEPYEDVKIVERESAVEEEKTIVQPEWEEGITISYWIKSPSGKNSNVVGFTNERFQMQIDDYAYYLNTVRFDSEYNQLSDEDREILGVGPSGVLSDSIFYFDYAEYDENGNPLTYEGKPVYISPEEMGELYWINKFYEPGYYKNKNGEYEETDVRNDIYENYSNAPYLGAAKDDYDPGTSNIRYGWTYGEMWLDASSSFYFINDATMGTQLNTNHKNYGVCTYMQDRNCFYINSWRSHETFDEAFVNDMTADSPLTEPDKWHYVTVVIQNDWVSYYLDGELIDVKEEYSSAGMKTLATVWDSYIPWKNFNKGAGARYGYGVPNHRLEDEYINSTYARYVSPTMMEWLIMDSTEMTIGGGNLYGDKYNMFADTDEIKLKNVVFYDKMLNAEQIEYLAENPFVYDSKIGDVNTDGVINADDALAVLKYAARLEDLQEYQKARGNVAGSEMLNAEDALEILKYAAGIVDGFGIK